MNTKPILERADKILEIGGRQLDFIAGHHQSMVNWREVTAHYDDMFQALRDMRDYIAGMGWRDISSVPKDGTRVDLYSQNPNIRWTDCFYQTLEKTGFVSSIQFLDEQGRRCTKFLEVVNPTHWMSTPPKPVNNDGR